MQTSIQTKLQDLEKRIQETLDMVNSDKRIYNSKIKILLAPLLSVLEEIVASDPAVCYPIIPTLKGMLSQIEETTRQR